MPTGSSMRRMTAFGRVDVIVNTVGGAPAPRCTRPSPTQRASGTGSSTSTCAPCCSPTQAAARAMIAGGRGGHVAALLLGPRPARDRQRVLGLRGRQGRARCPDPPAGHRMGQAPDHRQRDLADLRRHRAGGEPACRRGVPGRTRGAGSRCTGSPTPTTSSALRCCCAPTPSSFITGQVLTLDGGLTACQ